VSGLAVQACGDAHLSNFGLFGSAERRLMFDVNDFDETLPGPWEWDVKRLAASLEVAGRDNRFPAKQRREIVVAAPPSTGRPCGIRRDDQPGGLVRARGHRPAAGAVRFPAPGPAAQELDKGLAKARTRDSMEQLGQADPDGRWPSADHLEPPLLVPIDELIPAARDRADLEEELKELIAQYQRTLETDRRYLLQQYEFCDMALKVVGVGSVGTRCWIVLMLGRDDSDPLFLQVKEAEASVLSRFVGASKYANQGQRVVAGQRADAGHQRYLPRLAAHQGGGWTAGTRDFYVRQLRDWKFSVDIEILLRRAAAVRRALRLDPGPGARPFR
jgi:uncharacterized protein (DUF2252 family)